MIPVIVQIEQAHPFASAAGIRVQNQLWYISQEPSDWTSQVERPLRRC